MKPLISLIAAASLVTSQALAANTQSLSTKIYTNYSSVRALGMGNAFTAVADDYSLIMYNPAGFARKKHNEVQFSLLGAGVSSKTLTIADDISKAADTTGTDSQKAQAVSDALEKYYGQSLGGKVQAAEIFWIRKNWGFALLPADVTIDMSVNRQVGPALDLNVRGDTSAAVGFGTDLTKEIDMGITARYVHRVSIEQIVPAFELATDSNVLSSKRFKEGTTADFDIGFMYTPNWFNSSSKKDEAPPVKSEVISTPVTAEAPKKEEAKPEEVKSAETLQKEEENKKIEEALKAEEPKKEEVAQPAPEKKAEETPKTEDVRAPQAEGEATAVQTEETKPVTPTEDAAKAEADAKAAEEAKGLAEAKSLDDALGAKPSAEDIKKIEEKKPEEVVAKPEEKKEEKKTEEVKPIEDVAHVKDLEERYPLSFGLVVHNVLGGKFTLSKIANKDATEVPTEMYRVIDVGSQYKLYDGEDFTIRYMLDFQNLLHPEISFNKAFHTGIEFDYSPSTWFKTQLRAGINQMYYTAGASFLFGILGIDLVTYGEEVGTSSQKIENRVYAAKVALNF